MSDTTYLHEVTRGKEFRVSLTMDSSEARAIADIAAAAIDSDLLATGDPNGIIVQNAEAIYKWATRAAATLENAMAHRKDDDAKE